MEEVEMEQPPMPEESLLESAQGDLYISSYQDNMTKRKKRVICYNSNKSAMSSVVIG